MSQIFDWEDMIENRIVKILPMAAETQVLFVFMDNSYALISSEYQHQLEPAIVIVKEPVSIHFLKEAGVISEAEFDRRKKEADEKERLAVMRKEVNQLAYLKNKYEKKQNNYS